MKRGEQAVSPASRALRSTAPAWLHVALFSAVVNILMLTGSIYMLQVYDRVLASRSVSTLVMLSLIVLAAFLLQGVLDAVRMRMLTRIGAQVDAQLSPLTANALVSFPLKGGRPIDALQPMRDLDALRGFLGSAGPTALLDMPFMPIFLAACFFLHPWLGWLAVAGAVVIVLLTLWTEHSTRSPTRDLMQSGAERSTLAEAGRRNAEAIEALGMNGTFARRYDAVHRRHVEDSIKLSDASGGIGSAAKVVRFALQSAVLGLGAYLAILGQISAGAMIAASILTSRALAPIELAVGNWRQFMAARQGYARLHVALRHVGEAEKSLALPQPRKSLRLEDVTMVAPATQRPIVQGVSLEVAAGHAVGVIGPSGSGKSTLARAIIGVWPAARGAVKLDGAAIDQWDHAARGQFMGYLPQDVELFDGTIAENIARFSPDFDSADVVKAAEQAGAHGLIVSFADGYETRVGEGGVILSGGQRQRIALARALYGEPFLVVLDEPNSSLDSDGDEALTNAIRSIRGRGGIVVVVTHRPSGLAAVDLVAAMGNGRLQAFGPRDEVMRSIMRPSAVPSARPGPAVPANAMQGGAGRGGAAPGGGSPAAPALATPDAPQTASIRKA